MKRLIFILAFAVFYGVTSLCAQEFFSTSDALFTAPKSYTVPFTHSKINIDGKADENAWTNAPWSDEFVDIEGSAKPAPLYNTGCTTNSTFFRKIWVIN